MKLLFVISFVSVCFQSYSQIAYFKNKESKWKKDLDLVLDKIVTHNQKIFLYQKHPFIDIKDVLFEFDSLNTYLKTDSTTLTQIWETHKLNFTFPFDWLDSNPRKTKEKILNSKKWKDGEIMVLSASATIYVDKNVFLIEITRYCGGLCFFRNIYLVEKINDEKDIIIKFNIASGAG